MTARQRSAGHDRRAFKSRDVSQYSRPVMRVIGDGALTTSEIIAALPNIPRKDIRRALLALHRDGWLIRVSDATATVYALADGQAVA